MGRRPIIAIDFDGTITKNDNFPEIGSLRLNAREAIIDLAKDCDITLWTCRVGKELTRALIYCAFSDIPIHHVNTNNPSISFRPEPKIFYDLLIDDRSYQGLPEDWWEINKIVRNRLENMRLLK